MNTIEKNVRKIVRMNYVVLIVSALIAILNILLLKSDYLSLTGLLSLSPTLLYAIVVAQIPRKKRNKYFQEIITSIQELKGNKDILIEKSLSPIIEDYKSSELIRTIKFLFSILVFMILTIAAKLIESEFFQDNQLKLNLSHFAKTYLQLIALSLPIYMPIYSISSSFNPSNLITQTRREILNRLNKIENKQSSQTTQNDSDAIDQ